jgi:hypothetical protein
MNTQYKKLILCAIVSFSSISILARPNKKSTAPLSQSAQLKQEIKKHKSAAAQAKKLTMDSAVSISPKEEFPNKAILSSKEKTEKYYSDKSIALALAQHAQGLTNQPLRNLSDIANFAKLDDADTAMQIKKWLTKHNQQLMDDVNENKQNYKTKWRNFASNTEHKVLIDVKSLENSIKHNDREIKKLKAKLKRIENSGTPEYQRIAEHIKHLNYSNMIHEESITNLLQMVKVTLDDYDYHFNKNEHDLQRAYYQKNRELCKTINQILDVKGQEIQLKANAAHKK